MMTSPRRGDAGVHAPARVRVVRQTKSVYKVPLPGTAGRCPACGEPIRVEATVRLRRVKA